MTLARAGKMTLAGGDGLEKEDRALRGDVGVTSLQH